MALTEHAPLVDTQWLAASAGKPGLNVFDISFFLPTERRDPRAGFEAAHIPGALFFDIEAAGDQETDLPHMVPTAGRFARMVAALGVSNGDRVVFYDQKGMFSAARGWWLMRLFGHDSVAALDGGLPKWMAEGRPVQAGQAPEPAPGHVVPSLRAGMLRGLGDMRANLVTHEALVLDARPAGRFDGTVPEPRPGLPGGHIPGSVSLPASALLAPDQTFLPPDQLRARFAAAGADGARKIVTSCGTGVTAAILALGMTLAGLPEPALYDGSWTEWASHPDTPKEI
jgi:thiosulfate/3-mercaptopyruvate sulfurtransferase